MAHTPTMAHATASISLKTPFAGKAAPLRAAKPVARATVSKAVRAAASTGEYPDMTKRNLLNLALVGAVGLPGTTLVGGFAYFFVPPRYAPAQA